MVNYKKIDPLKIKAQGLAKRTSSNFKNFGFKEVAGSRGESAFVWEEKDCYRAEVIEGLGTKNLIADEMFELTGKSYYKEIARDTIAMMVNDIITVGAKPMVISAYFASGDSVWFESVHSKKLIEGWYKTVKEIGAVWGGGESPAMSGLIQENSVDLAGSVHGLIKPKENLVIDENLKAGDQIVIIGSNGVHANGLTTVRDLAKKLPKKFITKLSNNKTFGEEILRPSFIYSDLVEKIQKKVKIKYMVNVTGHGWRKIMRARNKNLRYIIEKIPEPQEIFSFIKNELMFTDKQMYETFNMNAGFVIFAEKKNVSKIIDISNKMKFKAIHAGFVERGSKEIIIKPLNITFKGESLDVRY